jgi:hypothetical protein
MGSCSRLAGLDGSFAARRAFEAFDASKRGLRVIGEDENPRGTRIE